MATDAEAVGSSTSTRGDAGIFDQPGEADPSALASINSTTGVYTWNTTGANLCTGAGCTTYYSTQVIIEDRVSTPAAVPNPTTCVFKSSTAVDWLIRLVPVVVSNPPIFVIRRRRPAARRSTARSATRSASP